MGRTNIKMILKIIKYGLVFALGVFSTLFAILSISLIADNNIDYPLSFLSYEKFSPQNWIDENGIVVFDDKVVIYLKNPSLSRYAWSGSMRPVLDGDANGIRIVPESADQISVGDIITFEKGNALIVHRVVEKGIDEQGTYFITKGDNNDFNDGKIRFNDIKYVTVAIVY